MICQAQRAKGNMHYFMVETLDEEFHSLLDIWVHDGINQVCHHKSREAFPMRNVPSLKPTASLHLKKDGGKTILSCWDSFSGANSLLVLGRTILEVA